MEFGEEGVGEKGLEVVSGGIFERGWEVSWKSEERG